ncbi:MAG: heavy-metal-associated domain-containing protein [Planctomycetaceae bacterium]
MITAFKTNLNCQSCVAKVRPLLEADADIDTWDVDTSTPDKVLTVSSPTRIDRERIVDLVEQAGFWAQAMEMPDQPAAVTRTTPSPDTSEQPFQWSTYRPLLLVVAYVLGLTIYSQWITGSFGLHDAMRWFMGYFFLAFAFFKLLNVTKFADAFSTYDVLAKRSRLYAMLYPFVEFALGIAYLLNLYPRVTNGITVLIMTVGLIGVISAVRKKQAIQCACLGTAFNLPMSSVTIIENTVMALMAAMAFWQA